LFLLCCIDFCCILCIHYLLWPIRLSLISFRPTTAFQTTYLTNYAKPATSDSPCSQTMTMQMMRSCSLRTTLSGRPSSNHLIQLRTLWTFTHPGQKLKFKMLPPDLHHLPLSNQDIEWKRSIGLHISAVMLTHRATVHKRLSFVHYIPVGSCLEAESAE